MQKPLIAALALLVTLSACGGVRESRLNPFNWFGRSEARASSSRENAEKFVRPGDQRPLVDQVISMAVEQTPEGAILRATGLPPTQGYWDAELVRYEGEGAPAGVLVFDFRLSPPFYRKDVGREYTREVVVAKMLTLNDLAGISRIVVRGARTERSARR